MRTASCTRIAAMLMTIAGLATSAVADPEFPPFEKVSEGYTKVVSTADGSKSLYTLWKRDKDGQMLAELPKNFEKQTFYLIPTVAGGDPQIGVYSIWNGAVGIPARQLYWSRRGNELALIEPNLEFRSNGDKESRLAVDRVYTDRVILSTPIVTMGPSGGPVIDLDRVLMGQADTFFGRFTRGGNKRLAQIAEAKAFPYNIEVAFEFPRAGGQLGTAHYSLGMPPKTEAYKPREADRRVGLYYVNYTDRGRTDGESQVKRYITRWHIEKADPKLKMSPPKEPIVYHIEHTTPVRYRRWVRDGILAWNKAFEKVGIVGAIEVRQQDARTGAYMDIDPEDMRYSFVRWTNSSMGFAIGPVHAHADTGEIYEADIVMDEGFIWGWANSYITTRLASAAMMSFDPTLDTWLAENPEWDPRYRLAAPADKAQVLAYHRAMLEDAETVMTAPPTLRPEVWIAHEEQAPGFRCSFMPGKSADVALLRTAFDLNMIRDDHGGKDGEESNESILDGLPESFIGPLLKDVVMHEVGHTMGLMHNWKGSSKLEYAEINSENAAEEFGTISGTVMDYMPLNIVAEEGDLVQGDYTARDIGEYDHWAIEWAYTFDDPDKVVARAAEHGLAFTAEDGQPSPDPHAKVWDISANSIDYAENLVRLSDRIKDKLIDEGVKEGESWEEARGLFQQALFYRLTAVSQASNWIGGSHINKLRKGDENAPDPIVPVDMDEQRRALEFAVETTLEPGAFELDPEILTKLGSDNWYDTGYGTRHDWPIHDTVLGIQASALSILMNPTRLERVLDNEVRSGDDDPLTVPDIFEAVREAVWSGSGDNIQRNLQNDHLNRLISLARGMNWPGGSKNAVKTLARRELRILSEQIDRMMRGSNDAYAEAHLLDAKSRIESALNAMYLRQS